MRKIRIPMASLEESHNVKRVEEDRTIAIEAAIVRIMKVKIETPPYRQIIFPYYYQVHSSVPLWVEASQSIMIQVSA